MRLNQLARPARMQQPGLLGSSAPRARKSHLHLPRFATPPGQKTPGEAPAALVQTGLMAALWERNPAPALATLAGVGQGQGVFESKHSQSTAESENLHMGYTHSWNRPTIIEPATFNAIRKDLLALLPALESAGSPLADAYGRKSRRLGRSSSASTGWPAADMPAILT